MARRPAIPRIRTRGHVPPANKRALDPRPNPRSLAPRLEKKNAACRKFFSTPWQTPGMNRFEACRTDRASMGPTPPTAPSPSVPHASTAFPRRFPSPRKLFAFAVPFGAFGAHRQRRPRQAGGGSRTAGPRPDNPGQSGGKQRKLDILTPSAFGDGVGRWQDPAALRHAVWPIAY